MAYYPIFIEMKDRRCLVIGGGAVAERKVAALACAGACITVIAPEFTANLAGWAQRQEIKTMARRYHPGDLAGYEVVFVATDEPQVNAAVHQEGKSRGVWVNAADDPAHCDFILPAVIRRGELTVAISTGGASPALARAVREELESYLTEDFGGLVRIASEVRDDLREKSIEVSAHSWNQALRGEFRSLVQQGRTGEAKQLLRAKLEDQKCE